MTIKNKITLKGWSIVLTIVMLLPLGVDLAHHFSHGDHEYCTETGVTHFHQQTADCELCDFQITPVVSFLSLDFPEITTNNFNNLFTDQNIIFDNYPTHPYPLRGPPVYL